MDPIEVPLKLILDQASLEQLKAQVYGAFQGSGPGGSPAGESSGGPSEMQREVARIQHEVARGSTTRAREALDKMSASGSGYGKGTLDFLRGLSESKRAGVLAANPELQSVWERASTQDKPSDLSSLTKKYRGKKPPIIEDFEKKMMRDKAAFTKDMSFLMMPLMNPGSLWATLFSTRQTFSAMSGTAMGKRMSGGTIGGAAMMTGGLVAAATALGLAFMALKKSIEGTLAAYENARKEYGKALMSGGLPLSFTVRRGALADVLGVSEKDVFQFGRQISYLNDKLAWSNSIIAKTTPALAQVGWEFKIVGQNLKATFADIANKAAPAMLEFAAGLNVLIKALDGIAQTHWFKMTMGLVAMSTGAGFISQIGSLFGKPDHRQAPQPLAYMKQLGASPWERMGLVIGGASATNPQVQTAKNTAATVKLLHGIHQAIQPRSGAFTMNPAYSNP
jgi:hypothetical protein